MLSGSRPQPMLPALIAITAVLSVALTAGAAAAATVSPSPTPSPSGTASDSTGAQPSPLPSPSTSASSGGVATSTTQGGATAELVVGIDRWIRYASTATAIGGNGLATATLAMPKGLVPIKVRGRLESIADSNGTVRIRIGTNYVEMDAATGGDFELAVPAGTGALVDDNLTIEVRNTLVPPPGECVGDSTTTEEIKDLEVGFIGRETPPTTIAGFFSPPVQKVTLVSPDTTDMGIASATLSTAGALATRYGSAVPVVPLTKSQFEADPTNLVDTDGPNRIVELVPTDTETVSIDISNPGVPTLTLSGPIAKLDNAGAALASAGLGLAAVDHATGLSETRSPVAAEILTLADLGAEKPTLSGLGRLTYSIPVTQDRFGGPIDSYSIHLEGAHTPVPEGGAATASLLWNDQLVQSQALGADDKYTADVTIDGTLVRRDNFLVIQVDSAAPAGQCGTDIQPVSQLLMRLDVNGAKSTISASAGQVLRSGFTRFPQAFGSALHVGFGSGPVTPSLVQNACALVISLQRASASQLEIIAEDFKTFSAGEYPGLIVGATPADTNLLKAPLRFEQLRVLNAASTDFEVNVDGPFAALEAFENDGRNLVLLGSTGPAAEAAPLMAQISDEVENGEFGWFGLRDNLVVAQPEAELLFLDSARIVPQATPLTEERNLPPWWLVLIALILVLVLVRWLYSVRRSRRVKKRIAEIEQSSNVDPTEQPPDLL